MEEDNKLKLVIIGLVLAALAISYIIITQKMRGNQATRTQPPISQQTMSPTPTPQPLPTATPAPQGQGGNAASLPKTGVPLPLLGIFASSAIISGYFLRKFPE